MKIDLQIFRANSISVATRELNEWFSTKTHLEIISIQATDTRINQCEVTVWYRNTIVK